MSYPSYLLKVIDSLKRLPGVGAKTAERFAFQLLGWPSSRLTELSALIAGLPTEIIACEKCGALMDEKRCPFCNNASRDFSTLCIVASPKDVFAVEETGSFRGIYHVLDGLLSPIEGKGPEVLELEKLVGRIEAVNEVIIALDSTLEGDATSLFLKRELEAHDIVVSRLAFGLPMGSPLDYVDSGTLAHAFSGRR